MMAFNNANSILRISQNLLSNIYYDFQKLDNNIYQDEHNIINDEINKLYIIYHNDLNISYHQMSIIEKINEDDRNQFIKSKNDFINKLNNIKRIIVSLKEKLYPWPWNEVIDCKEAYVIPQVKKSMEFSEIDYVTKLSLKEFHLFTFHK